MRDVFVELFEILKCGGFIPELDEGCECGISCARTLRVRDLNFAFIFWFGQIRPATRYRNAFLCQAFGVHTKAQNAHVYRRRVVTFAFGWITETFHDVGQFWGLVSLE
ncbi:Uncharacterised protein [Vibrio cholerae]|nr:Uncharacterised protein [Vibrio cholerae]CSC86977.1 Uncharacterised protein [Vibrio cholerae]